mmetsp:Transcript_8873/g.24083  ORF Transcript_8873/g.24083 Transcript_8873/m.24083 type:complete len:149 (-) Transcript_8873:638-1084(-)|eukprot:CAMPEP_0113898636 /NCGR_PEP_ID=MMETSP0780_2-20120614/19520_1 /TAXON_ID=652834 /ORGANISM="Palpitomonas bilix" /LENGTH=148 /DNA_ID=CAMNT_0000890583 /DNA_START=184 /DNA_END=630 /DNA_ORIENTATION=+ /assembly_acc=CAM_ASM_000599
MDYINAVGPYNKEGGISEEVTKDWIWPPRVVIDLFHWWCEQCDPVLRINYFWFKIETAYSTFLYAPFYPLAIYGFIYGKDWVRVPILMFAWGMLATCIPISLESVYGHVPSPNPGMFMAGYGAYLVFPFMLIIRLFPENPFAAKEKSE